MVFEVDLGWWLTGDMALPDSHELSDHTHPFTLDILMTLTKSSHIVIPMLMMSRVVWWLKHHFRDECGRPATAVTTPSHAASSSTETLGSSGACQFGSCL